MIDYSTFKVLLDDPAASPGLGYAHYASANSDMILHSIHRLRLDHGKNFQEVAKSLMISTTKVSRIETGCRISFNMSYSQRDVPDLSNWTSC